MTRNTSVSLDDDMLAFIEAEVARGHYSTPSDVLNASLRLLASQQEKLAALRAALIAGERSGRSDRNVLDIWAAVEAKHSSEADG